MIRNNRILLLALLLLLPFVFPSCESEPAQVKVRLEGDYRGLLEAIRTSDQSLSDKLVLVEGAVNSGLASSQQAIQLIQDMLLALDGTAEEKLAAIQAAMTAQTTALETKLALLEAAVQKGFANSAQQQELLQQALSSLGGTVEQKLSAIEKAVKAQTSGLESKIGLIETAVQKGFADSSQAQALIKEALEALGGTLEEKLTAIDTAMTSQITGLESKVALLIASLEGGLADGNKAIEKLQKALDSSLKGLDAKLSTLKADILGKLDAISGQITEKEMAKAFQGILDAIDKQDKSTEEVLQSVLDVLKTVEESLGHVLPKELIYMGHPTERVTVSCGQEFKFLLRVNPSNAILTPDILLRDIQNSRQFFLSGVDRSQAMITHYSSYGVEAGPEEGFYMVTMGTLIDERYCYWDESYVVFKVKTGDDEYAATEPIPVAIMPNPKDGLTFTGLENTATFRIKDTVVVDGRKRLTDSLGVIYQPLAPVVFTDGTETRTYSPEFLESALFDSFHNHGVKTVLDKEKSYVRLYPDLSDSGWDVLKDSTHVNYKEITGNLEITDRWGGHWNRFLDDLTWYTSYADTVLANPTISGDGTLAVNLMSKATSLGLIGNEYPGSTYCEVKFEFASASGAWRSAQFKPGSWELDMVLATYPSGSRFTVDALVTQHVQPDTNDSSFRPIQRMARIRVTFTVQ